MCSIFKRMLPFINVEPIRHCMKTRVVTLTNVNGLFLRLFASNSNRYSETSEKYTDLLQKVYLLPDSGHHVLIIQPSIKSNPSLALRRSKLPNPSLSEAIALVDSLEGWTIATTVSFNLRITSTGGHQKYLFSTGVWSNISDTVLTLREDDRQKSFHDNLVSDTCPSKPITAVFVNWPRLTTLQLSTFQRAWSLPVYDRYTLVVQLFTSRAQTREAKAQAQLVELGLLRARLPAIFDSSQSVTISERIVEAAPFGGISKDQLKEILTEKERKLLSELEEVESRRQLHRQHRRGKGHRQGQIPVVAVVGYTNAGKTSLIRCLSGNRKAVASPQVFATLDISRYRARLPSISGNQAGVVIPGVQLTFVDTIGFMSDLPTSLLAAFRATLQECLNTDLILHIVDIGEEGWERRIDHVNSFLGHCGIDVLKPSVQDLSVNPTSTTKVLKIGNKADLGLTYLPEDKRDCLDVLISTTEGTGIYHLAELIQSELAQALGWIQRSLGVRQGSPVVKWLYTNAMVMDISAHPSDAERLVVSAIFTTAAWSQFVSHFGGNIPPPP